MLEKYNGAILADAVGLGKTWTALAVMKFYQLQGRELILICPKKLHHNWKMYLKNQESKFENDNFEYFIRFHTDLTDDLMEKKTDRADKFFTNDKPKLFVIDESHNLRNDKSKQNAVSTSTNNRDLPNPNKKPINTKFSVENMDLVTWFIVSK